MLALMVQNMMVGRRQEEGDERYYAQRDLEAGRASDVAGAAAEAASQKDATDYSRQLMEDVATGKYTLEQAGAMLQGNASGLAPQPTFTGVTGIGAEDAAGMNLGKRTSALEAAGTQDQPAINKILGQPQGSSRATAAPSIAKRFPEVAAERARAKTIADKVAEFDPAILAGEGALAAVRRPGEEEVEGTAAAGERGRQSETPVTPYEPSTEQAKALGTLTRIGPTIEAMDKLMEEATFILDPIGGSDRFAGGWPGSAWSQQFSAHGEEFARAVLRLESGAAITEEEKIDLMGTLPERGDTREGIAAKLQIRNNIFQSVRDRAGNAPEPVVGGAGETPNGRFVIIDPGGQ
jgi:hypothetical protein